MNKPVNKKGEAMEKQLKRGVLAVIFMVFMMGLTAIASTTDVTIEVTYDQTSARSMLDMINDFRKGPDAWAWDKTNNDMVPYTNLSDLNYDYELEKVAMQRAAEIAIYYSHTRPDGSECQTAGGWGTPQNLYGNTCGENIAVGQTSAEEAFVKWREDNDNYDGQGHRRNMLGGSYGFSSIGIAHVIFNGSDCWVQEFGNGNHDTATEAFNGNKQITISVDDSYFTNSGVKLMSSINNLNVVYLSTEQLPEAYPYIWLKQSFNSNPSITECPVIADLTWEPADDSIVSVSGNTVTGKKVGSTVVSTSYLGKTLSLPVTVQRIPISQCTVNVDASADYAFGDAVIPGAVITYGLTTLTAGTDYEITAASNTNAGTASYTVTGKGNYEGTKTGTFTILPLNLSGAVVNAENAVYTGSALKPAPTVTLSGKTLTAGTDYTIVYSNNTNAGTASVSVTGKGNFTGKTAGSFTILPADISEAVVTVSDRTYTGSALTPVPTVKLGSKTLTAGTDYTTAYADNINAGTATVTVTGKGNYAGSAEGSFTIEAASIKNASTATIADVVYTGEENTPSVGTVKIGETVLTEGIDYTREDTDNVDAGTAKITLTGKGNYKDSVSVTYKILPADISEASVSAPDGNYTYTGIAFTPALTVQQGGKTLTEGTDYTAAYSDNINAGTATVTVTGKGNYTGKAEGSFTIGAASLQEAVLPDIADFTYTGTALTPTVGIVKVGGNVLTEGTDYTREDTDNVNVGTAKITLTGKGNYKDSVSLTYEILPADIAGASVSVPGGPYTYTGSALTPDIEVTFNGKTLVLGTDYTVVAYADNINAGIAAVTVAGTGNFTGQAQGSFKIDAISLSEAADKVIDSVTYTGLAYRPNIGTVTLGGTVLVEGDDYTREDAANVNAGTGKIILTGNGNYKDTKVFTYEILPFDITDKNIEIQGTVYNGKSQRPQVVILEPDPGMEDASPQADAGTLKAGVDFTAVNDPKRKNAGTLKNVVIAGTGNYTGQALADFTVAPAKLSDAAAIKKISDKYFTGSSVKAAYTLMQLDDNLPLPVAGTDFTEKYTKTKAVGTASLTLTGTGNYTGTLKANYKIIYRPKNSTFTVKNGQYKITKEGGTGTAEVAFIGVSSKSLTEFSIPKTVTYKSVSYKVTSIGSKAFRENTKIKKVNIGSNVKKIGSQAFYKCSALRYVTIYGSNLTSSSIGTNAFKGTYKTVRFTVPSAKLKNYKKWILAAGAPKTASFVKK